MSIKNEFINDYLKINESYEMPSKLMNILKNKIERENMFDSFLDVEKDLSYDWFTNYFQDEHGDRNKLKQDFTPNSIARIISGIEIESISCCDICAGTGGLIISEWNKNKKVFIYCEEISTRAIPILLFNLAIRGINAIVANGNSLTKEFDCVFRLKRNGNYSEIEDITKSFLENDTKFDKVIMNPPYSVPWCQKNDERFEEFGLAPKSKADYSFVLHGLYKLKDSGCLIAVLPHGILFRGSSEQKIRKSMIDKNIIDAVVGLPDKLFLNTSIPVCLLILKKNKKTRDIMFIDASREFKKGKKQNELLEDHIEKIIQTYKERKYVDKYAYVASLDEIISNDFNLNIPRYVDTFEEEEVIPLREIAKNLTKTNEEINKKNQELISLFDELIGTTADDDEELKEFVEIFKAGFRNV